MNGCAKSNFERTERGLRQAALVVTGPTFLWFLHQPTSVSWLTRELAARRAELRFAFTRPGLTTFKVDAARADDLFASSFACVWERSLGRAATVDELLAPRGRAAAAPRLRTRSRPVGG